MALTFGTTGMDRTTEGEVHAAFNTANASCGNVWTLVTDDSAEYVMVDLDSLYGPMSWLKLQGAGRKVIGLTSSSRSKTPYRLGRPIKATELAKLLSAIANGDPTGAADAEASAVQAAAAAPAPAEPAGLAAATEEDAQAQAPVVEAFADAAVEPLAAHATTTPEPDDAQPDASAPSPLTLRGWLGTHSSEPRARVIAANGIVILIDKVAGVWHGPKELKTVAPCFSTEPGAITIEAPDDATWGAEVAKLGASQPLSRLKWLAGLLSGRQIHGAYQLRKWPQIEREYPRHFRIATLMMKIAGTAGEFAEAAGVPEEEVRDFINASLATGYAVNAKADAETPAPAAAPEPPASSRSGSGVGGLFGRRKK